MKDLSNKMIDLIKRGNDNTLWEFFVEQYSEKIILILKYRFNFNEEKVYDIFLELLEHLHEKKMQKLKSYSGASKFLTWLTTVINNKISDYFRKKRGRIYIPTVLKNKPEYIKKIYAYYKKGLDFSSIYYSILNEFPNLSITYKNFILLINTEILNLKTSKKADNYQLIEKKSTSINAPYSENNKEYEIQDDRLGPEKLFFEKLKNEKVQELMKQINRIVDKLSERDKLIFKLRYIEQKTNKEIENILNTKEIAKKTWNIQEFIRRKIKEEIDMDEYRISIFNNQGNENEMF